MITVKKYLRDLYCRVGGKRFEKGVKNMVKLVVFAFLFALFANLISSCQKTEPEIYEVRKSGVTYRTSEANKRLKEPEIWEETIFFAVGGEQ
ncbi:MAG: hypothetical protein EGR97_00385 [Clostridiales bacterium]|nr:hypothetical protein [Clostridiales bacterium]